MTWIKTDDQMVDHPKYEAVSAEAFKWAHRGLSYANRYLTDGHLPVSFTAKVPEPILIELTTVAPGQKNPIWHRNADRTVEIHDFHDYQPSRKEVEKERRKARRRQAKWRKTKGKQRVSRNGVRNALVTVPPARPDRTSTDPPYPRSRGGHKPTRRELAKAHDLLAAFQAAERQKRIESAGPAGPWLSGSLRQQIAALAEHGLTFEDLYQPRACMHTPACDDVDDCLLLIVGERRRHEQALLERASTGPKLLAKAQKAS